MSAQDYFGPAPTAREHLRRWDAGESIWSIEMGGLGPGYEQAIQVLAIEIIRDEIDNPLPVDKFGEWGDNTVSRIDQRTADGRYSCGGFSGAQVGAAKQIAVRFIRDGPAKALKSLKDEDRKIQVSNFWPRAASPSPGRTDGPDAKPQTD